MTGHTSFSLKVLTIFSSSHCVPTSCVRDVNILLGEKTVYVDRIYVDVKDHFLCLLKLIFSYEFQFESDDRM